MNHVIVFKTFDGIGHPVSDRKDMIAIRAYSPAEFISFSGMHDTTFPGLLIQAPVHIPFLRILVLKPRFITDREIFYPDISKIVSDQIPFGPIRHAYVPALGYLGTAIPSKTDQDINIPYSRLKCRSGKGCRHCRYDKCEKSTHQA